MRRHILAPLLMVLIATLLLPSCAPARFDAGDPLSSEELEAISAELFSEEAEPNGLTVVYWVESGSTYHTTTNCRYLKNAANVRYSSLALAVKKGKSKPCSACAAEE